MDKTLEKRVEELEQMLFLTKNVLSWKIQCKLPPKTKRFCPLVLK